MLSAMSSGAQIFSTKGFDKFTISASIHSTSAARCPCCCSITLHLALRASSASFGCPLPRHRRHVAIGYATSQLQVENKIECVDEATTTLGAPKSIVIPSSHPTGSPIFPAAGHMADRLSLLPAAIYLEIPRESIHTQQCIYHVANATKYEHSRGGACRRRRIVEVYVGRQIPICMSAFAPKKAPPSYSLLGNIGGNDSSRIGCTGCWRRLRRPLPVEEATRSRTQDKGN